jgi:hypothetical protein
MKSRTYILNLMKYPDISAKLIKVSVGRCPDSYRDDSDRGLKKRLSQKGSLFFVVLDISNHPLHVFSLHPFLCFEGHLLRWRSEKMSLKFERHKSKFFPGSLCPPLMTGKSFLPWSVIKLRHRIESKPLGLRCF